MLSRMSPRRSVALRRARRLHPALTATHSLRCKIGGPAGEWIRMIFRSVLAFAALAGLVALSGSAVAQQYSPYGAQVTPVQYRPVPAAPIPDDDDDIPANQRATGNI